VIYSAEGGDMAKKSAKIIEIKEMMGENGHIIIEQVGIEPLRELRETFDNIEDKRFGPYVEHPLSDIVMITLLAVMARANDWKEIAEFGRLKESRLREFLVLPHGIPSHDTIQRVMAMIDGKVLYSLSIEFLLQRLEILAATARQRLLEKAPELELEAEEPKIVAIDGKTSRGGKRNKTDRDAVKGMHTVSAYSTDHGVCLSEVVVKEKTNEIPAVRDLLKITEVKGCVVTWEALNTQKETVAAVIRKSGDYVGALKGNRQELYEDVKLYFDETTMNKLEKDEKSYEKTIEKEQSGVARREYYLTEDISRLSQKKERAGLKSIGCARRTLKKLSGEVTVETRYFIASITEVKVFAKSVRWHWGIENKIHWHLDFTFKDDQNTTTEKYGARNLQTMKRVALAVLSLVQSFYNNRSLKRIRYILSLGFEEHIQTVFKLLNANAIQNLLLPRKSG
jgi:predicted transposase YbfD/YdcC